MPERVPECVAHYRMEKAEYELAGCMQVLWLFMKVVKSYSLDLSNARKLEDRYPVGKRSEVVNEALKWYLGGDKLTLDKIIVARDSLQARVLELSAELDAVKAPRDRPERRWWIRLLLGR